MTQRPPASPPLVAVPSRMLTAGRHTLCVATAGSGAPAVVFEPGLGGVAADWAALQAAVAAAGFAAIAYDRAGHGRSSPARDDRRSEQIAADLRALLQQIARPPFVLVGQSLGGVHVRAYARLYAGEVAGLVLVESSDARLNPRSRPAPATALRDAARQGLQRLLRRQAATVERDPSRRLHAPTLAKELRAFQQGGPDDVPVPGAFGAKPLLVLTAAQPADADECAAWEVWRALHAEQALLSRNSRHLIAPFGGHDLQRDAPAFVLDAVLAVCRSVRDGTPLGLG